MHHQEALGVHRHHHLYRIVGKENVEVEVKEKKNILIVFRLFIIFDQRNFIGMIYFRYENFDYFNFFILIIFFLSYAFSFFTY